jgi:hypothetical protein
MRRLKLTHGEAVVTLLPTPTVFAMYRFSRNSLCVAAIGIALATSSTFLQQGIPTE